MEHSAPVILSLVRVNNFLDFRNPQITYKPKEPNKLFFLALSLVFLFLCTLPFPIHCHATTPGEEYKKIQREIKKQKKKLKSVERRERSILADIEEFDQQLSLVESEIRKYRRRIKNTESEILKVEADISLIRSNIDRQREWIKRKLRALQKYGLTSDLVMFLSSTDDISQLMKRWKYLQQVARYEHKMLNAYHENLNVLYEREKKLTVLKAELLRNEEKVRLKEEDLTEKKKDKEVILASVRGEKSSYKKMLKELKEASKKLLEIIRESEKADTYGAKGFTRLKGNLPWPVEGSIAVPYGSQKDPQFNTPVFRSGIFIQANENISVKAVHIGKVVFAEWFKGYGKLMIVNHGDGYHTLYGSLSEIFSKVGDIINKEQIIGQVGNSGIVNASGLYFELRYKGKPLDPVQWLKKK